MSLSLLFTAGEFHLFIYILPFVVMMPLTPHTHTYTYTLLWCTHTWPWNSLGVICCIYGACWGFHSLVVSLAQLSFGVHVHSGWNALHWAMMLTQSCVGECHTLGCSAGMSFSDSTCWGSSTSACSPHTLLLFTRCIVLCGPRGPVPQST